LTERPVRPRIRSMFGPREVILSGTIGWRGGWLSTSLLLLPALMLVSAAVAGPDSAWVGIVGSAFAPFCHQQLDRCVLLGRPLAVCARCAGFYFGLAGTALAGRFAGRFRPGYLLAGLPLVVDGSANLLGLWLTPAALRALTGVLAAVPLGQLARGVADED
jgi:uncharacterized membrane protein